MCILAPGTPVLAQPVKAVVDLRYIYEDITSVELHNEYPPTLTYTMPGLALPIPPNLICEKILLVKK